ncbi:lipoprotein insertase outer membrane protein LolB [Dyella sp.]|uniref:lipoprotein insertase outer membrane protein LolB n=1 Tax=Dyella sp. TaxID=1869338 RepID=UPI002ED1FF3C
MYRNVAAVLLALLLVACVPKPALRVHGDASLLNEQQMREQALAHVDQWTLEGRIAVSDARTSGSGDITWVQDGEHYVFTIRGPFGKSFRLTGGPDQALIEGMDGGPLSGPDAEDLLRKALGWEVPLHELRAWVLGLRADGGPAELSFGVNRLPSLLQQDGWNVDYREWDATRRPALPKKVFADKAPFKVKLSVESWRLGQ